MSWGAEDLSAALGASSKYDADGELSFTYQLARSLCLAGAVAAGVQPVDGVFADFRDEAGLDRRSATPPRREGFTGKLAIHPAQVARDQRRLHPVGGGNRPRPRRSSPRSRPSPTPACCRSAAKWSTGRTSCRRGAYWTGHDRRLTWRRLQNRNRDHFGRTGNEPTTAKGWGTDAPDQPLRPMEFERRALRPDDVAIKITYAGICHSDLHTCRNDWGGSRYPVIPGHEIVGTVTAVGDEVTRHRVGDTVAVGCMVDSCMECDQCLEGWEVFCRKGCVQTYNSADYHDGTITKGGYTDHIVVRDHFVLQGPRRHGRQPRRAVAVRRHHHLLAAAPVQCRRRTPRWRSSASAGSATWASSSPPRWART